MPAFSPDHATDIYTDMVNKRASMQPTPKSNRNSTMSIVSSVCSASSTTSTTPGSKLSSIFSSSPISNSSDAKEREMMPDGTKLGKPIDGFQYVKGSPEEKMAQAIWVQKQLEKAGIM